MSLQKLIESFVPVNYSRVQRGEKSYRESLQLTASEITRLIDMYKNQVAADQTARLLRDSIDHWIRRYHGYAIEGSIGAHYREIGVDPKRCVFEHVIPAAKVRDMLLQGVLTVSQALNTPTCLISQRNDEILREQGHASSSPNYWNFFERYAVFDDTRFSTYNGQKIENPHAWTLQNHFEYFQHES